MKTALRTLSFAFVVAVLGAFSFADAAVVYSQPSGSSATSTTLPLSGSSVGSAEFVATANTDMHRGTVVLPFAVQAGESWLACLNDSTTVTQVLCTGVLTGDGVLDTKTLTFASAGGNEGGTLISGNSYNVRFYAQSVPGITAEYMRDSSGVMMVSIFDASGGTPTPNWGAITVAPPIDFNAVSFVSTSTSFFSATNSSSTLEAIAEQCSTTGNVFSYGLCRAFSYLFVPNPSVLNQFQNLGPQLETRFPVSWVYQVQDEIDNAATTTLSSPVWTMNLQDIGIGSTTSMGNILPNMVVFSSSTVKHYISDSQWNALMTLAGAAIWLVAFYTLYGIGHKLFSGHRQHV